MPESTNPPTNPGLSGNPSAPAADPAPVEHGHFHFLAWAERVPHNLLSMARDKVKKSYARLEHRYGPGYAKAIVGAGLAGLPIPIPFSTALTAAPVVAAAELHRALEPEGALAGVRASVELTVEHIDTLGKNFMQELHNEFTGQEDPKA